jgi:hypothetical protein
MAARDASQVCRNCADSPTGLADPEATVGYDRAAMADQAPTQPLDQQLEEIGAQLAWVRDYL